MKKALLLSCAVVILSSLAVTAQEDTREARLSVAQDYVEKSLQDMDMVALIRQMWQPIVDQLRSQGMQPTQDQIRQLDDLYQQTFTEPMRKIMLQQKEVMADVMTLEEITALRDFYTSPVGHSVMQKLPRLLARQQPMIMEMIQEKMPQVMPKVQEIFSSNQ